MIASSLLTVRTTPTRMVVTIRTTEPRKRETVVIDCTDEERFHNALGALIVFSEIIGGAPLDVLDECALHSLVAHVRGENGHG